MALKPPIHGRDHCPGGADPIPCLTSDYCFMRWDGPETVTVNTLSNPATLGSSVDYAEGFSFDSTPADFSLDLNLGNIEWGQPGWYHAHGWALFNGGATAGSSLGVVLDFGTSGSFSTYRVGNSIITAGAGINDSFRIPVDFVFQSFNPASFGHDTIRLLVWHDDAGGQDLNSAYISLTRLSPNVDGTFI